MAKKMVHLFLTPKQADLVHWSLLLSRFDLEDWDSRTGQPAFASERDVKLVLDKLIRSKRKAHLPSGGVLFD